MSRPSKEQRKLLKRHHLQHDPLYQELHRAAGAVTLNDIERCPDLDVEWLIVREVLPRIRGGFEAEKRAMLDLPKFVAALCATWLLESDVRNGGFEQFFFNQQPFIWERALEGYSMFGIEDLARATDQALEKHLRGEKDFQAQESPFMGPENDLTLRKAKFIKTNAESFVLSGPSQPCPGR
jgi:hypothetical protein